MGMSGWWHRKKHTLTRPIRQAFLHFFWFGFYPSAIISHNTPRMRLVLIHTNRLNIITLRIHHIRRIIRLLHPVLMSQPGTEFRLKKT
jgi:hypothetical protein